MATRAPLAPPPNETESTVSRITREGKKLTYKLNVMQQPERARACGAGAKCTLKTDSSADRRPVDPPPVVELRVFESDPNDDLHQTDITFAYNANFFLYATLETARPMAQGRYAPNPTCPVLTGVPVAGVAYLDRPSQAGYFIFPDLSVRHEGVYRLNFHLYEETKDSKDANENAPIQPSMPVSSKPMAPKSFLDFRLEVVSVPFTVFSAKKFPGLTTSTSLSRVIAEQGCRVRIRRDVRMRRRGEKRQDDYEYDEERVYRSSDRYSTPDAAYAGTPVERPRSTSISTVDHYPYGPDAQRRPSSTEYGFQTAQPYQRSMPPAPAPAASSTPAPAPPSHASFSSHLSFGSTQPQYQAPQLPPTPQSATTPTNVYSPHPSYPHVRNPSISTDYEPTGYPYPPSRMPAERPSYPKAGLPPLRLEPPKLLNIQPSEPRSSDPNAYQSVPSTARSQTPSSMVPSLPPLKALSGDYASHPQPPNCMAQSPIHDFGSAKKLLWDTGASLTKRSYEDSFGHDDRPLYNGMRPDSDGYPSRRLSDASRSYFNDGPEEDVTQASRQLYDSLASATDRTDTQRKHSRTDTYYDTDDWWSGSETSGQFDDADESDSIHSAKRRRSNEYYDQHQQQSLPRKPELGSRWPFHSRASSHGSPRGATGRHARPSRGRRSRFVEGMMNDSVSEKPPSIFLREGKSAHGDGQTRNSGIFRFGKAIASAFNPFGGWGEMWKGAAEANKQQQTDDAIARAEKAYAELKKAGYKGAVKGKYTTGMEQSNPVAEQTWASIHEKMDYRRHSRQFSGEAHETSGSLRTSFQDLRRARSSLGITSIIPRRSEDADQPGDSVRKQKSKKELQRQAKLIRRVSTLEEKLERARRELQELMGEEALPRPWTDHYSICQDPAHQRRFVPGALPSLPSERLLYNIDPVTPTSFPLPGRSLSEPLRDIPPQIAEPIEMPTITKSPLIPNNTLTVDSPSLKRKSPDPESQTPQPNPEETTVQTSDSSRRSKLPKTLVTDSPGSVDRKQQHQQQTQTHTPTKPSVSPSEERGRRRRSSQPLRSHSKRSPSAQRRASNSQNRGGPSLRMKKGRADLRSHARTNNNSLDKENQHHSDQDTDMVLSDASPNTSPSKRKEKYTYNYIPPVPPLPKDLAATAAKVDRRLARQIGKPQRRKLRNANGEIVEEFKWPGDIF
ncbi:velvet factor-domain-containing protein [Aspergillus avenaceus]|uniref:Developmental and secondary metabolism regulator veA n=1 Tax=Aspergillus avenaceus TaxID=36643 RepID=A0A5N6U6X6_ASPAV|nr:velvet factor-domain-containing protein [Aspergillus avenaceus]